VQLDDQFYILVSLAHRERGLPKYSDSQISNRSTVPLSQTEIPILLPGIEIWKLVSNQFLY
jgi:hypothetical protein